MTTTVARVEQRFLLDGVDWDFYESLLRRVGDRHIFITYDRGRMELMSPSWKHDKRARRLGLLIGYLADSLDMAIEGGGSTTFRREDLDRGLEPDQCFYIEGAERVRGKDQIDLERDPPPDLVVEVEITRRTLDRGAIYAALGVPEMWRDDGRQVRVYRLGKDGRYEECDGSPSFPGVSLEDINRFMDLSQNTDEVAWGRAIRAWAKETLEKRRE
jgi:Uma2 family endonuclease